MARRIMVDLSMAAAGYAGIPQDTRQIYSMLAHQPEFSVSGLMYPLGRPAVPRIVPGASDAPMRAAGVINAVSLGGSRRTSNSLLDNIYKTWKEVRGAGRGRHNVQKLPDWLKTDAIWRVLFQKTLPPNERERILRTEFLITDLTVGQMFDRAVLAPFLGDKRLNVSDVDAVLFPLPRPIRLPRPVMKVVRYHDAFPLTNSDTVVHWLDIYWHHRFTNHCAKDGIFVCNSPMSIADLDNVAPGAGDRATVIPCAVQQPLAFRHDVDIAEILVERLSLDASGMAGGTQSLRQSIEKELKNITDIRYIISVSSLEPRKNFVNAIAAWERVRAITGHDIKLVIVASSRWKQEETFAAMRPHVMAGNLIHVERVPLGELQTLYRGAELCLFPSYAEGFGYAPLEALQMEIPVVVSDLPVFRWSMEDAALFADPYDVGELTEATLRLIKTPENAATRMRLLERSKCVLRRFAVANISEQWARFFGEDIHRIDERSRRDGPKY